jgi:hypothetical protein
MQQNLSFHSLLKSKIIFFWEIFMKKMIFIILIILPFIFHCSSSHGNSDDDYNNSKDELIPVSGPEYSARLTIKSRNTSSSLYKSFKQNSGATGEASVTSFKI